MDMSNSNNIISKPVSLPNDVAAVVGTSNDLASACVSGNINIYSRHKPMRINTTGEATTAMKKAANYGYVFPVCTLVDLVKLIMFGTMPTDWTSKASDASYRALINEWYYAKPRGLSYNEWYRLLDFDGYAHFSGVSGLIYSDIPSGFQYGASSSFSASIAQERAAQMAPFWGDDKMALTGYSYEYFGVAVVKPGTTAANLTNPVQAGRYVKYYIWPSSVSGDHTLAGADGLFVGYSSGSTMDYTVIPFICGKGGAISSPETNIGSDALTLGSVIPLPCAETICRVTSTAPQTDSFSIYGVPTFAQNVPNIDFSFAIAYTSGLQGVTANYLIEEMNGDTRVAYWSGTVALNTSSGSYPRHKSMTRSVRATYSGNTYRLTVSYSSYPSVTKNFREQASPIIE